jgi:hypothetical protein
MTCEEAAEFVSALYDYETIPQAAAGHIGVCAFCQARLKEYIEIGVELRRVASLECLEEAKPRVWETRQAILSIWWQKGWETMRIPRFAFALVLMGIVGLSSGLTIVGVRAHTQGTALLLKVALDPGHITPCALSTEDKKYAECGWQTRVDSGMLTYKIELLSKDSNRVELGVRTLFAKSEHDKENSSQAIKDAPEKHYWFEPGKTLQIDVAGLGPVAVTGEWFDHMPYFAEMDLEHNLAPKPNEIRMISPLLLRGDRVVCDAKGDSFIGDQPTPAFWMYVPGNGVYILSLTPFEGGVRGHVENNRVSFEIDGQSYQFVTAAPVTRNEQVWVSHLASVNSPFGSSEHASFGVTDLNHLPPSWARAKN